MEIEFLCLKKMIKNNIDKILNKIDNLEDILNGLTEKRKILLDENDNKIINQIDEKIEDLNNDIDNTDSFIKTLKNELMEKSYELKIDIKKYKTKLCNFDNCKKHFCTYAHNKKELRQYIDNKKNQNIINDHKEIKNNNILKSDDKNDQLIEMLNIKENNNKNNSDHVNINEKDRNNNITNLVNEFHTHFEDHIKYIKKSIDDEKYGIDMKIELNKIMSDILLFKNNIYDILK